MTDIETGLKRSSCGKEVGRSRPLAVRRHSLLRALALSLLSGAALLPFAPAAQAATITWTGATSDDWLDPTNWNSGTVPTDADTALVDGVPTARIAGQAPGLPNATAGQLAVGTATDGQVDVIDQLDTGSATLGNAAGSSGAVNVIGDRAAWTNGQDLVVGDTGTGALNLSGGGTVTTGRTVLGSQAGSTGWAAIFGDGSSLQSSDDLVVGADGTGTLDITAGGTASNGAAQVGVGAGGNGGITVVGDGSLWQSRDTVSIGVAGQGSLSIRDGGTAQGTDAALGLNNGSAGSASVTGNNSLWSLSGNLGIGGNADTPTVAGGTGSVTINGGGAVEAGSATLGDSVGSAGSLTVSGGASAAEGVAASTLAVSGDLAIGTVGTGAMSVADGGEVEALSTRLGIASGALGAASIDGDGSRWSAGLLSVGVSGTGTVAVTGGGSLVSGDATIGVNIDASGAPSTVAVLGNGSTWESSGTINVGGAGDGRLDVAAGGSVSDTNAVIGASAGGNGVAVVDGTGTLWQTQDSLTVGGSGDGALTVSAGGNVTAGNAMIATAAGSTGTATLVGDGSSLTVADTLVVGAAGNGSLTLSGGASVSAEEVRIAEIAGSTGTLTIGGAAGGLAAGAGILDADRVVFGGGKGQLVINTGGATNDLAFDISGDGSVAQYGGDTVLGGDSSYTGGTEIRSGSLTLGTSTAAGTGAIELFDDTRLGFANGITVANDIAFGDRTALTVANGTATSSGDLSGGGNLDIDGTGTLLLTGDGSAYTGAASLSGGGGLVVDGSLGGSIDVQDGGTLGGDGTVGDTVVRDGGTVAPSNLSVAGDIAFDAGSTLRVRVAGNGDNDSIDASGGATLDGGTVEVVALDPAISFRAGQSYTILTADGGVSGTFDGTSFTSIFLDASLQYGADDVTLTVTPNNPDGPSFTGAADTPNQRASASGLDGFDQAAGSDAIIVYNQVLFSPTEQAARRAFDLASGEIHATTQTALAGASDLFTGTLQRRAGLLTEAPAPTAPGSSAFGFWGGTIGQTAKRDGDGNAATLESRTAGIVGGAEFAALNFGDLGALTAGIGFGYSRTDADVAARLSEADIESGQVGLYAALENGPVLISTALSYGHHGVDLSRNIAFGSIDRLAESSTNADSFGVASEARYRLMLGGLSVAPLATLDITHVSVDGTREHGAESLNLTTEDEDYTTGDAGVGLALGYGWSLGSSRLRSEIRAAYERGFGDTPEQTLSFLGGPVRFTVLGADARDDRLALGAGLGAEFANGLTLTGRYDGAFGGDGDVHSGHLSAGYRF